MKKLGTVLLAAISLAGFVRCGDNYNSHAPIMPPIVGTQPVTVPTTVTITNLSVAYNTVVTAGTSVYGTSTVTTAGTSVLVTGTVTMSGTSLYTSGTVTTSGTSVYNTVVTTGVRAATGAKSVPQPQYGAPPSGSSH